MLINTDDGYPNIVHTNDFLSHTVIGIIMYGLINEQQFRGEAKFFIPNKTRAASLLNCFKNILGKACPIVHLQKLESSKRKNITSAQQDFI